jgi:hypothetical protein
MRVVEHVAKQPLQDSRQSSKSHTTEEKKYGGDPFKKSTPQTEKNQNLFLGKFDRTGKKTARLSF